MRGSNTLQGGSKGAAGSNSTYIESGGVDQRGAKYNTGNFTAQKGAAITVNNSGVSPDLLTSLVGSLTSAQPAQISQAVPTPFALSPPNENPPADQSAPASTSMPSKTWLYIAGAVVGLILLIFLLRK